MAADAVNFQASWINDAEFALFTASTTVTIRRRGLEINYLSGGPGRDPGIDAHRRQKPISP